MFVHSIVASHLAFGLVKFAVKIIGRLRVDTIACFCILVNTTTIFTRIPVVICVYMEIAIGSTSVII